MASIPINNSTIQMSTPINSLPLKTNTDVVSPIDEDPIIQNLLKDFEQQKVQSDTSSPQSPVESVVLPKEDKTNYNQEIHYQNNDLNYNKTNKTLFDKNIVKKSIIIVGVIALIYNTSILESILSKLPSYISIHLHGKDIYIYLFISFCIIYLLQYYDIMD